MFIRSGLNPKRVSEARDHRPHKQRVKMVLASYASAHHNFFISCSNNQSKRNWLPLR